MDSAAIISVSLLALFGLFASQALAAYREQRRLETLEGLIRHVCDTLCEHRRADHRDNLAQDRLIQVLVEKMQCDPAWAAERHARERVMSEENQARVMAQEVKSSAGPVPPEKPRPVHQPYEDGVPAESLEAAQE